MPVTNDDVLRIARALEHLPLSQRRAVNTAIACEWPPAGGGGSSSLAVVISVRQTHGTSRKRARTTAAAAAAAGDAVTTRRIPDAALFPELSHRCLLIIDAVQYTEAVGIAWTCAYNMQFNGSPLLGGRSALQRPQHLSASLLLLPWNVRRSPHQFCGGAFLVLDARASAQAPPSTGDRRVHRDQRSRIALAKAAKVPIAMTLDLARCTPLVMSGADTDAPASEADARAARADRTGILPEHGVFVVPPAHNAASGAAIFAVRDHTRTVHGMPIDVVVDPSAGFVALYVPVSAQWAAMIAQLGTTLPVELPQIPRSVSASSDQSLPEGVGARSVLVRDSFGVRCVAVIVDSVFFESVIYATLKRRASGNDNDDDKDNDDDDDEDAVSNGAAQPSLPLSLPLSVPLSAAASTAGGGGADAINDAALQERMNADHGARMMEMMNAVMGERQNVDEQLARLEQQDAPAALQGAPARRRKRRRAGDDNDSDAPSTMRVVLNRLHAPNALQQGRLFDVCIDRVALWRMVAAWAIQHTGAASQKLRRVFVAADRYARSPDALTVPVGFVTDNTFDFTMRNLTLGVDGGRLSDIAQRTRAWGIVDAGMPSSVSPHWFRPYVRRSVLSTAAADPPALVGPTGRVFRAPQNTREPTAVTDTVYLAPHGRLMTTGDFMLRVSRVLREYCALHTAAAMRRIELTASMRAASETLQRCLAGLPPGKARTPVPMRSMAQARIALQEAPRRHTAASLAALRGEINEAADADDDDAPRDTSGALGAVLQLTGNTHGLRGDVVVDVGVHDFIVNVLCDELVLESPTGRARLNGSPFAHPLRVYLNRTRCSLVDIVVACTLGAAKNADVWKSGLISNIQMTHAVHENRDVLDYRASNLVLPLTLADVRHARSTWIAARLYGAQLYDAVPGATDAARALSETEKTMLSAMVHADDFTGASTLTSPVLAAYARSGGVPELGADALAGENTGVRVGYVIGDDVFAHSANASDDDDDDNNNGNMGAAARAVSMAAARDEFGERLRVRFELSATHRPSAQRYYMLSDMACPVDLVYAAEASVALYAGDEPAYGNDSDYDDNDN